MTATPITGRQRVLWILPPILVTVALGAAAPWLRATIGQQMLSWIGVGQVTFVVSYGIYYVIRVHRGLDEVQKAATEFSATWGMIAGLLTFALLFTVPPFLDFVTVFIRDWVGIPEAARKVVVFSMGWAVFGVAIFQSMATAIMRAIWWKSKE